MARGTRCVAHHHDYPTAEEHHHTVPLSRGGARADVWLCANAHGDVHYFLDLIERAARRAVTDRPTITADRIPALIPGRVAVHYGPKIRRIARIGWAAYGDDFLAGVWNRHAALWLTSGQPVDDDPVARSVPPFDVAVTRVEVPYWLSVASIALTQRGATNPQPVMLTKAPPPRGAE